MTEFDAHYDVAVIGGRPAGASLAARLGARGLRVLVVDRAELPSHPAVASIPVVHPGTMRLLDELGIDERLYGDPSAKMTCLVVEFNQRFHAVIEVPEMFGRAYVRGVDRRQLDTALWKHLDRFPTVTARQRFSLTDVIRDASGRVAGFEGKAEGGEIERIGARWVIGADGRYSTVARKVSAKVIEEHVERTSTIYAADWENVSPPTSGRVDGGQVLTDGRGTDIVMFNMPGGRVSFTTHQRADLVRVNGDVEGYYLDVLRRYPAVARRLVGARRVTEIVGIKRIANRYVEVGGPGWALVGDAAHHKDPVDAQGIYDALIGSKILADLIASNLTGAMGESEAIAAYEKQLMAETHAMYLATQDRIKRELYEEPPDAVINTMIRWLMTDPVYQRQYMLFIGRAIPPEGWLTPALMRDAVARGVIRDAKGLLGRVLRPRAAAASA